mmetsp:Transcript_16786/g.33617  ORF Transcript_16786/g.33617 Transcript_16786/m.33617 type:complete len:281 (+) Transcript_16786:120-962(+)|eukprot:CAMPEP_0181306728 /NCGR_PEP_ID=MMETSP1101-20121128/10467_1 /TAXON_ID=46948 /ORGANISM="Rhodomonas abbreviata, Strain Caron Lab Isolate" /LENGTH=280 /DNA_ID=CAMNT_0023412829 /DNA_START=105 /DNA_END=947 /DNA_ORIENTATION=-
MNVSGLQEDERLDGLQDDGPEDETPAFSSPPVSTQQVSNSFGQMSVSPQDDSSPSVSSRFGGGDKCPRCNKTVYFAEAREGPNNKKYHRPCFACALCKKTLDSTFAERQQEIYCKACYGREFGPKTFGYSPGSTSSPGSTGPSPGSVGAPDATPSPEKSPSSGFPYKAAQTPPAGGGGGGGSPYGSRTPGSAGSEGSASNKLAGRFGGGDKCPRCNKTVYMAEAKEGPNNIKFHRSCFSCLTCAKTLDSHFSERKGELYCKPCYTREFGPKGFGHPGASS